MVLLLFVEVPNADAMLERACGGMEAMLDGEDLAHVDESLVFLGVEAGDETAVLLPLLGAVAGGRSPCRGCGWCHYRRIEGVARSACGRRISHARFIEVAVIRERLVLGEGRGKGRGTGGLRDSSSSSNGGAEDEAGVGTPFFSTWRNHSRGVGFIRLSGLKRRSTCGSGPCRGGVAAAGASRRPR